jgi:hypothetical protein
VPWQRSQSIARIMPSPGQVAQPRPQQSDITTEPLPLQAGQGDEAGGGA